MPHTTNHTNNQSPRASNEPLSDDENTLPPNLSLSTSKEALIKIARQQQAGRNALSQENETLRRKLADISNKDDESDENHDGVVTTHRSKRQRTRRAHNNKSTGSDDETQDDTSTGQADSEEGFVNNKGHKFCIIYAPWVHNGADIFKTKFDDTYDPSERFENEGNKVQGQLHDIIGLLEEQLSQELILRQKWVRREFMKGLNTQRANTASRIRHNCSAVFGIPDIDLVNPEQRKVKFRGRIGWVPNGSGGGTYSSVDVDIIHKDYSGKYDLSKIFLNPVLMGLFVAIIRGPNSAKNFMLGNTTYQPQTETIARIHGIRNITPGAIATCAILARWGLSSDVSFQEVGSSTGIRYSQDYEEYFTMLEIGLRRRKKTIMNIFKEWDSKIFPDTDSSLAGIKSSNDVSHLRVLMESVEGDDTDGEGDN